GTGAQPQLVRQLRAQKPRDAGQPLQRLGLLRIGPHDAHPDQGVSQVAGHLDRRDRDEPDTRVAHVGRQELRHGLPDQLGRAHAGVSERATSSTLYASIRSPTLMSLNPSIPMPHSKPSRTSRTSSLKRLSDAMPPSYTSTPSRITCTRAVRGMTPERTKHPAM